MCLFLRSASFTQLWACVGAQRLGGPFRVSLGIVEKPSPSVDLNITWLSVSSRQPPWPAGLSSPWAESAARTAWACAVRRQSQWPFVPAQGGGCGHSLLIRGAEGAAARMGECGCAGVCPLPHRWGDL